MTIRTPVSTATHKEDITFGEFVGLFPLDKWVEVKALAEANAQGRQIMGALKEQPGTFSIKNLKVVVLLNAIKTPNTSMTSAEIEEIKKGKPV